MTLTQQVLAAIDLIAAHAPSEARAAQKLRQNVRENVSNPLIPRRLGILLDNARGRDNARGEADFSTEDLRRIGQVLAELDEQLGNRPGPPKQFPLRFEFRFSDVERDALTRIVEQTGEDRSETVRRLVREADPG